MLKRLIYRIARCLIGGDKNLIEKSREAGVVIGDNCRLINYPSWGSEPWLIELGNHVELSSNVQFVTHDGATWVFRDKERYKNVIRYGKIKIMDNCFIGTKTTILQGVTIGPNSIVGACSLVRSDVLPNSVYAGVPAKFICTLEEYAEKCLKETPEYDIESYFKDKRKEVLRVYQ